MSDLTAIVWFRPDLRLHDHPALRAALERADRVVPVFCFDDRLLHGRMPRGAARAPCSKHRVTPTRLRDSR